MVAFSNDIYSINFHFSLNQYLQKANLIKNFSNRSRVIWNFTFVMCTKNVVYISSIKVSARISLSEFYNAEISGSEYIVNMTRETIKEANEQFRKLYNQSLDLKYASFDKFNEQFETMINFFLPNAIDHFINVEKFYFGMLQIHNEMEIFEEEMAHLYGKFV